MHANIGIPENHLQPLSTLLNTLLADEYVLYTKTRNYHWNVTGASFMELHKLFESQYEQLDTIIDDTAERSRALGHYALGSLKQFIAITRLVEEEPATDSKMMLQNLLNDHETIIRVLRSDITTTADKYKDAGTSDFLTGLMEQHEKMAWFIRAHLG
ncbi:MAG: Ferritin Dps family protein [Bacteroidetes bacterium]|nr:Ferritin Dps family protein [Bacteroidota bacterium]